MDVGAELKRARIARAKYIPQIAHEIKSTAPIVQAMERGDFAQCGGDAECQRLVRAFAASVGIEAEPLLSALVESGGVAGMQAAQAAAAIAAHEAEKALAAQAAEVKAAVHQAALDKAAAEAAAVREAEAAEAEAKRSAKQLAAAQKLAAKSAEHERRAAEKAARRSATANTVAAPGPERKSTPEPQQPEAVPEKAADPVKVLRDGANRTAARLSNAGVDHRSGSMKWMLTVAGALLVAGAIWGLATKGNTPAPSPSASPTPTASFTASPTSTPTEVPTATPTLTPSQDPTSAPESTPTPAPTPIYKVSTIHGLIKLRITCLQTSALRVYNASGTIFLGKMKAGAVKTMTSDTDATFRTSNAAGFSLSVSGWNLGKLGVPGQKYTHEFRVG